MANFLRRSALHVLGLLVLIVGGWPRSAGAFEFAEHALLTTSALKSSCSAEHTPAHCDGAQALEAFLARESTPPTLGELTGMAGDHAVSPPSLLWRFYFDGSSGKMFSNVEFLARTPENVGQRPVPRGQFLRFVRQDLFGRQQTGPTETDWVECRNAKKKRYDGELAQVVTIDSTYLTNAVMNLTHFRAPVRPQLAYLAERDHAYCELSLDGHSFRRQCYVLSRTKPARSATAMYGALHAGALYYARLAKLAPEERDVLWSAAMFLEVYALHFLQDSVSSGHLLKEATPHPAARKNKHDDLCITGQEVAVPVAARDALGVAGPTAKLFGDGALWCAGGENGADRELTRRYAELVTSVSLNELSVAYDDERIPILPALKARTGKDKPCESDGLLNGVQPLHRAACEWWEPEPELEAKGQPEVRQKDVMRLAAFGYFRAHTLLPTPVP